MDREAVPLFLLDNKLLVNKVNKIASDANAGANSDIPVLGPVETFREGGNVVINPEHKSIT